MKKQSSGMHISQRKPYFSLLGHTLVLISLGVLFVGFTPIVTRGQPQTPDHLDILLDMSLEELLQVEVSVSSRRPVQMRYVSENVTVVTAQEIKAMNAHNVNDVLRTLPGLFQTSHENYGGTGDLSIQGSEFDNIVILLDNIRMNDPDSNYPTTLGIPVQIIDRIEIVKGPGTSVWGSAIGGVINIITRDTGNTLRPTGTIYSAYGEAKSQDYRIDAAGKIINTGYYLYGGYQKSDGLREEKSFDNKSFYAKIGSALSESLTWTLTAGSLQPEAKYFADPEWDQISWFKRDNLFVTGNVDSSITDNIKMSIDLHYAKLDHNLPQYVYGSGLYGEAGELLYDYLSDTDTYGGTVKFIWEKLNHTFLAGLDYDYGKVKRKVRYGPYWQSLSLPPEVDEGTGDIERSAIFFNDTIKWADFSITPGLRYDHLSISDDYTENFFNPSLGFTFRMTEKNLLRATVARGHRAPDINLVDPAVLWHGSPDLQPEDIWSYQAGIESTQFGNMYLKADLFYHQISESWQYNSEASKYVNSGDEKRKGFEVSAATSILNNLSGSLGFTYVHIEPPTPENIGELYSLTAKINYSAEPIGQFLVIGRFVSWDYLEQFSDDPNDDNMIWDIHYNKNLYTFEKSDTRVHVFASIHNLFNGSQYWDKSYKNPERWIEAGLRITF